MIIGGAGEEKRCRGQIEKLGIWKNVLMTGWLPTQNDVNKYLNASDCLLVTRRNTPENYGVIPSALFHSLTTGKPTVAAGLPGMSEFVRQRKTGYLFEPDNYEHFKSILEYLSKNKKEAKSVGKAGMKSAEKYFDADKIAQEYLKVIEKTRRIYK